MQPQPQTVSKQLIQGLAVLSADERHNTFILRRYNSMFKARLNNYKLNG
jgi:hypothetical protein